MYISLQAGSGSKHGSKADEYNSSGKIYVIMLVIHCSGHNYTENCHRELHIYDYHVLTSTYN